MGHWGASALQRFPALFVQRLQQEKHLASFGMGERKKLLFLFPIIAGATTLSGRFAMALLWGKFPPQSEEVEAEEHKLPLFFPLQIPLPIAHCPLPIAQFPFPNFQSPQIRDNVKKVYD
jgi:hypothetical protein